MPHNDSGHEGYAAYLRQLADYWRQYDAATGDVRTHIAIAIELHIRANERRAVMRELQDFHNQRNASHG